MEVERGGFQRFAEVRQAFLRLIRAHRFLPQNRLHLFQVQRRSDPEHALPVKASVRHQDMAVGIEFEEVVKGLDGDGGAGEGIPLWHPLLKKELQGFPGAATQIGKKIPGGVRNML